MGRPSNDTEEIINRSPDKSESKYNSPKSKTGNNQCRTYQMYMGFLVQFLFFPPLWFFFPCFFFFPFFFLSCFIRLQLLLSWESRTPHSLRTYLFVIHTEVSHAVIQSFQCARINLKGFSLKYRCFAVPPLYWFCTSVVFPQIILTTLTCHPLLSRSDHLPQMSQLIF